MTTPSRVVGKVEHGGIPVPPLPVPAPAPHWRLEAIAATQRPRNPHVNPVDGRIALIIDRDSSDVWVTGADGLERWTVDRTITAFWEDGGPIWSPNGKVLAYTHADHVWLTDGVATRRLCEAGSPVWIDDRQLIVELEHDDRTILGRVDVGADPLTGAQVRPGVLLDLPGDLGSVVISPDRTKAAGVRSPRDDLNASRIVVFDLENTVEVRELAGESAMHDASPEWSPDGKQIAFSSEAPGWHEVFLWSLDSDVATAVTDADADFAELAWSDQGMAAIRTKHGVSDLVLIDMTNDKGAVTMLAAGGVYGSPCWLGSEVTATHEAPDVAPRLVRVATDNASSSSSVTELVAGAPRSIRHAPYVVPEHIWYPAPGGDVPAFLYRPGGASPDHPCPAIVHPHGGPTSHYGAEWDGVAQYFIDKGYAWLAPNFKGSTSYGRDHERANHGNWGVVDTADCLAGHEWLAEQDWVDARRIGIFGASYGSYMALLSLVDGDRFACGVAKYGDCDILTSWAEGDRVGRLDLEKMMGHPRTNPDGYRTGSPIHRIESISAPIFVAHGEQDARVHPNQSEELVEGLRRVGATFDYVTYPSEGHGLLRREPFLDFYRRLERFLDWYLL